MDPATAVGIAAAAGQLAEQALKISHGLYQYFHNVKDAPKLSRELRQEAILLSDVVENLCSIFSSRDRRSDLPKPGPSADLLHEFKETMMEMANKVEIKDSEISWNRLAWPFTQKENEKYLHRLERFKSSFQLALQAFQSYVFLHLVLTVRLKLDNFEFLARRIDYTVQHSHQLNIGIIFGFFH